MEQLQFHKQKKFALIGAGLALVALMLPWISVGMFGMSNSINGFRNWGLLSLSGLIAVAALSIMGDKTQDYSPEYKKYVRWAFIAIAAGALLFWIRKNAAVGDAFGIVDVKTGIGLWLCLVAGLAGAAFMYGVIKIKDSFSEIKKTEGEI